MTVPPFISTIGPLCVGIEAVNQVATISSATWPVANRALCVPLYLPRPATIVKLWWVNAAAVSGNVDVGIYRASDLSLVVSSGSVAQSGTSAIQEADITDTALPAGTYLLALSCDNTTSTFARAIGDVRISRSIGMTQMASAFPLPSTIVPATCSNGYLPVFGASLRTVVA